MDCLTKNLLDDYMTKHGHGFDPITRLSNGSPVERNVEAEAPSFANLLPEPEDVKTLDLP